MKNHCLFLLLLPLIISSCTSFDNGQKEPIKQDDINDSSNPVNPEDNEEEEAPKMTLDDCVSTPINDYFVKEGYTSVYEDLNFKTGYIVTKPFYGPGESPYHDRYLRFYPSFKTPQWSIAQWSSRYDIFGNGENDGFVHTKDETGLINTITSKGKMVNGQMLPAKVVRINSITGEIYLESNCQVEYEAPRTSSDPWVHLLLANQWNKSWKIDQLSSIMMQSEFTVHKCDNFTGPTYNTGIHAAQLVWYITIQNLNKNSAGYGKYIWFGVPLFDNRTAGKTDREYIAHDAGTDTLIYSLPSNKVHVLNDGYMPNIGKRAIANVDVFPIVKEAFEEAKRRGYLANTSWEDLYIGGTNFGYEIPGTFNIATTIHSIGIFAK